MMSRFCRYVDKVFGFDSTVRRLTDARRKPQIPCAAAWTSAFVMSATRLRSLNAIDSELRMPRRLDGLIGPRKPSADTIGRVLALMDPDELRALLAGINHKLKRNKALATNEPLRFVAVDGHEFFSQ